MGRRKRKKHAGLVLEGRDFPNPGIDKPRGTDGDSKSIEIRWRDTRLERAESTEDGS